MRRSQWPSQEYGGGPTTELVYTVRVQVPNALYEDEPGQITFSEDAEEFERLWKILQPAS